VKLQPTTDSVDFFQVLDADGGTPIVNVDSTNERLGISTAAPLTVQHIKAGTPILTISDTDANNSTDDEQSSIELKGRFWSGNADPDANQFSMARIVLVKDASNGNAGSRLEFETTSDTTNLLTGWVRLDSSGFLGITEDITFAPPQQLTVAGVSSAIGFHRHIASALGPVFALFHSRNATIGSHTIVQNNDNIGRFTFQGSDGAAYREGAEIQAFVDGTPGSSDMPGRLVFSTTADGASSATDWVFLKSDGKLGINAVSSPSTEFDLGAGAIEFDEMTAPGGGAVNTARLYAVDNGAGKTQLAVVFNTGAVQTADGRWLVYNNGIKSDYFNTESEARAMANKIKFTERCQEFSTQLAKLFKEARDLESVYFDEEFNDVGTDPIINEDIESTGNTAADVAAFITVAQQLQKFDVGDGTDPVVTGNYGASINRMRGDFNA
jgi:hypothetical protein